MPAKGTPDGGKKRRERPKVPSRVDANGRTILPTWVRDELGLGDEGGHVAYEKVDGRMTVRKVRIDWS